MLREKLREILENNYGNPVGGTGTTHWYINDQATDQLLALYDSAIPKEKEYSKLDKDGWGYMPKLKLVGYNECIAEMKANLGVKDDR